MLYGFWMRNTSVCLQNVGRTIALEDIKSGLKEIKNGCRQKDSRRAV